MDRVKCQKCGNEYCFDVQDGINAKGCPSCRLKKQFTVFVIFVVFVIGLVLLWNYINIEISYRQAVSYIETENYEMAIQKLEDANKRVLKKIKENDYRYTIYEITSYPDEQFYKDSYALYAYASAKKMHEDNNVEGTSKYLYLIPTTYTGDFHEEINAFKTIFKSEYFEYLAEKNRLAEERKKKEKQEKPKEKSTYDGLTNAEKKAICKYIQGRYDYYDKLNGGYAGDKYSDKIMQEAANKYGITEQQALIIWMNMYSY